MEMPRHTARSKPFLMMGAGLMTGLAWPLLHHQSVWLPGLLVSAIGLGDLLFPNQLAPLWRLLEAAGKTVAHYNGIILLTLIYFLIITPSGIFYRWRSNSRPDPNHAPSFYERPEGREPGHMRRMF